MYKRQLVALLDEAVAAVLVVDAHVAAELDLGGVLGAADLEGVAVLQPLVRNLHLEAVLNFLLEHAVAVADSTAVGRVAQGCQRI